MDYSIKSKPTIYNGTKFRSRLEARWACFFDLLGWKFQYEPFDLDGWTPDFIVYGKDGRFVLIEIKPYIKPEILSEYQQKVSKGAMGHNCIILDGEFNEDTGGVLAGYQFDTHLPETPYNGKPYQVHWKDSQQGDNTEYDIGSLYMAFDGILWNDENNRKVFLSKYVPEYTSFIAKWVEAGEKTRFHYNG